ncbi:MAG: hypothetical protein A3C80_00095 [Candidatus Ryanbacteria bacterium RIFCSPHIGHO2_02_FULL_45_43]|uniref:Cell division protein FtsX n=1 Tax=Candidatus Ryanbacteria bacterium RIFCSPHIGHO2_01_45_13 TaxID=1802112 RepID=A0A1G2G165_9BACT|nr:MAG: hypothetical protein A2718_01480 [Candidatus Ryanbacteria bacterium RIFCSPHIGHO2_01_FULL_44_130]OGZ43742.1 MAG: hypothetical protein A2W41_04600 [Candidatus Ryanbacteria bacterium RIFCSPHIGHO2_01_45_13]OGZ47684.1 MAG: hypothetical protein A3C80_00095 [Candidatus Ryanbacteria bacterium RIFCSPHIGHO2_02_FULL_45_43]OGZ49581.1 MAG: hypothetical protein A3E55_04100 [Candidatus Ryanbacteria bacterium RIFCSPHIGHO2_12_FULL_44_20]OGZ51263.1 MAG: hypothetical protein A3A17_04425 [Candidatus Ryanba
MIVTYIGRVIKAGFTSFWRNGSVSFASILVMVLALFMIGSLLFSQVLLRATLDAVKGKIDISVYFKATALEGEIASLQASLAALPEVSEIEYISREDSLAIFRERHQNNALISSSLEELGENPLGAALNIRAKNPQHYENIALFLEEGNFPVIDKVNYRKNKLVIDRLTAIISGSQKVGIGITVVLGAIAMLIVFNTIRLAIFTSKTEIEIMKLVGASRRYIRSPYLVEGFLYGAVASIVTTLLFWPLTYWLSPRAVQFFGFDLYLYYIANIFQFFLLLFLSGVILGVFSSFIATRRYLKV